MHRSVDSEEALKDGSAQDLQQDPQEDRLDAQLKQHSKKVIEALLFASSDPLSLDKIRSVVETIAPIRPRELRSMIEELQQEYLVQLRAFGIEEIALGYVIRTHEEYAPYLEKLHRQRSGEHLSPAATEVLAIVAYRQPITRPQIDAIRGVDSSGSLAHLLDRQLVEAVGKQEAPGKPTLYATTKEFLKHFGLKDLTLLNSNVPDRRS